MKESKVPYLTWSLTWTKVSGFLTGVGRKREVEGCSSLRYMTYITDYLHESPRFVNGTKIRAHPPSLLLASLQNVRSDSCFSKNNLSDQPGMKILSKS